MAQQPPLLRDVIDIGESISTSDFVLQLSEATTPEGAERALRDYVVTERLLENFDEAPAGPSAAGSVTYGIPSGHPRARSTASSRCFSLSSKRSPSPVPSM
ncbi:hypothetical protein J7I94_27635 [Streptomyces sp. ISL-12]|uniref:hypothetical protein n=1 Tax=Streptomyces sp. ISL-12 TaxID=2819177 RepID=UPI001BED232B|nr:hypothetical protein [Streptomyces sp. ISL-12]MBT2414274.1 hypothetical protein [Streptomyces sp. ISL-12]